MAFLDRDGVLVRDVGYPHRVADLHIAEASVRLCRRLQARGFELVVVSNQSGIARGIFGPWDYARFTNAMLAAYARRGVHFRAVIACPHLAEGRDPRYARFCLCRKPRPGMLVKAARQLGLTRRSAIMIGDRASDLRAGRAASVGACRIFRLDGD